MKPFGISLSISPDGKPAWSCPKPSKAEDAIWEAVKQAIGEGMTPKRFKQEVAAAWEQELRDDAEYALRELNRD